MIKAFRAIAIALSITATCAAAPAAATSFVRVSDEALVDSSPLIVVGTVETRQAAARKAATDYRVRVEQVLKGSAGESLLVRVPGGGAGRVRLKVWGAPSFRAGERALLFLVPGEGGYRVQHLFLGAFHEVAAGDRRVALRNLAGARELRVTAEGELAEAPAGVEPTRDFAAFTAWVAARARGQARAADYALQGEALSGTRSAVDQFTLFADPDDGLNLRWFEFDTGGSVTFKAYNVGQTGLSGGGYSEFQTALQAWNNQANTPIDYRYGGTTNDSSGLDPNQFDELNTIVFNDPNGELPSFSCASGGVLAYGGPWYDVEDVSTFKGVQYHPHLFADIVVNDGLSCFFSGSSNGSKAAAELFAHELGHTLGLGHACGDGPSGSCNTAAKNDALMRASVHDDGRGAKLGSDDNAGIEALYKPATTGTKPAAPTNLTGAPIAGNQTTQVRLTWTDKSTNETEFRVESKLLGATTFTDNGAVPANTTSADIVGLSPATGYVFRVRARNAAGDSAYSNEATVNTDAALPITCVEDSSTLCLGPTGRYRVQLTYTLPGGAAAPGQAVPIASALDSGLFYFNNANDLQMLIKVLDACTINSRYWVFYSATTNVQFLVTVTDTQTGRTRSYFNAQGTTAVPVTDLDAFATCP